MTGLAGCAAVSGLTDSPPELGRVRVENADDEAHTVGVVVERDGVIAHWSTHELKAPYANDDGHRSVDDAVLDGGAWDGETGRWTVSVRVDDREEWTSASLPADARFDADCYALRLKIQRDASVATFPAECD